MIHVNPLDYTPRATPNPAREFGGFACCLAVGFVALFALCLSLPAGDAAAKPLQVMLLGDSFTAGDPDNPSFRYGLWKRLVDAELEFDFVGTQRNTAPTDETSGLWADYQEQQFDSDHQAYPDWRIDHVLNGRDDQGNLDDWLGMYTPDVAVVFLGTHDVLQNHPTEWAVRAMRRLVIALRRDNERIAIVLVIPPAVKYGNPRLHREMAEAFVDLSGRETTGQSPIRLVDLYHGFDGPRWFDDAGPQLSEEGAAVVAERIGSAILLLDEPHLNPPRRTSAQAWGSALVVPLGAAVGFFLLARTQLRRERDALDYRFNRRGAGAMSASSPLSTNKPDQ